jgi:hypothetical protein
MDGTEPGYLLSGRYRLNSEIGRGGMGVVWHARDELLKRDVAVKEILWPQLSEEEQQVACRRALREAQMAGRLSHQNVVRIYDIVEEDGHPSIVMELLPYRSLRDIVEQDGPLPPDQAAQVGLGVLAALRAAHREGILHRDVKPANILVGPDGRVVLTDFGIARAADSATLTTGGALLGSPSYIAPERAMGSSSGAAGPPGDLWGLGASLYTAVEGQPPFKRNGALATLTAVVADDLEEAVHAGPLAEVINGLLRKDPEQRLGPDETQLMLERVAALSEPAAAVRLPPVPVPGPPGAPHEETRPVEAPAPEPLPVAVPSPEAPSAEALPAQARTAQETVRDEAPAGEAPTNDPAVDDLPADDLPAGESLGSESVPSATRDERQQSGSRPARRSRGLLAVLAALVVAAVAVTVLAFNLTGSPRQAASPSVVSPSRAASAPASPAAPSAAKGEPSVTPTAAASATATPQARPSPSETAAADGTNTVSSTLPTGYRRFTDATGFSVGVPNSWLISHVGHYVYITDPVNRGIYLLIDQSDHPNADPLADWQQQQANRESSYADYHLIRLVSVSYPQAEKAADWEFTYSQNGVLVHVLNRNVLANANHAYALYWSTPEIDWNASYHYFKTFAATFRPAG